MAAKKKTVLLKSTTSNEQIGSSNKSQESNPRGIGSASYTDVKQCHQRDGSERIRRGLRQLQSSEGMLGIQPVSILFTFYLLVLNTGNEGMIHVIVINDIPIHSLLLLKSPFFPVKLSCSLENHQFAQ